MKGTESDELSLTRMQRGRKWQQENNHKRSGDKDLQEIDKLLSSTKKDELHAEERNGKDLPSPSSSSKDASSEYGHLTQSAGNWLLQQKTKKKQQKRVPTGIRNILMEEEDFLWDNLKSFGTEEAEQQKGTDKEEKEEEEEEEEEEQTEQKQKP
ncbi:Ig-like domain-containing protein, partial [Balamuthia mandrillaris]